MNSVLEHCPNSDSETVLSKKLVKCTVCTHTAQPVHPGTHRHAKARAVAVSWLPSRPCRSARLQCLSASRAPLHAVPSSMPHACAPHAAPSLAQRPRAQCPSASAPAPSAYAPRLMLKWAVAHFSVCTIFFSFLSSYWKIPKNIYTYFFSIIQ